MSRGSPCRKPCNAGDANAVFKRIAIDWRSAGGATLSVSSRPRRANGGFWMCPSSWPRSVFGDAFHRCSNTVLTRTCSALTTGSTSMPASDNRLEVKDTARARVASSSPSSTLAGRSKPPMMLSLRPAEEPGV